MQAVTAVLEQMPFHTLSPRQQSVLAAMEVDLYRRRQLPAAPMPAAIPGATWSQADCQSPLARAVARAAGTIDTAQWCRDWLVAGMSLPDLAQLRDSPAAKRALWHLLRQRR